MSKSEWVELGVGHLWRRIDTASGALIEVTVTGCTLKSRESGLGPPYNVTAQRATKAGGMTFGAHPCGRPLLTWSCTAHTVDAAKQIAEDAAEFLGEITDSIDVSIAYKKEGDDE